MYMCLNLCIHAYSLHTYTQTHRLQQKQDKENDNPQLLDALNKRQMASSKYGPRAGGFPGMHFGPLRRYVRTGRCEYVCECCVCVCVCVCVCDRNHVRSSGDQQGLMRRVDILACVCVRESQRQRERQRERRQERERERERKRRR